MGWLRLARTLQGVATGLATGALSAALIDLQPADRPRLGALMSSASPLLGLAAGALGAGLLVQYGPDPLALVYWLLLAVYAVAAVVVLGAVPETVPPGEGWSRPLRVELGVPASARRAFAAASPCMVATWALAGLYLARPVARRLPAAHDQPRDGRPGHRRADGGRHAGLRAGPRARGARPHARRRRRARPRRGPVAGLAAPGLDRAVLRRFDGRRGRLRPRLRGRVPDGDPLAEPTERGRLVAATIYTVAYTGFSLPAIAAGIAVSHVGLEHTGDVYATAVMVLAAAAIGLTARELRVARV